mmetsp:Transcript_78704/g.227535  ORF Transcript_78704/g.227535 Transcript_78704/m.227535 type:complete len:297 (-) Transcript_78704:850-1740(-)
MRGDNVGGRVAALEHIGDHPNSMRPQGVQDVPVRQGPENADRVDARLRHQLHIPIEPWTTEVRVIRAMTFGHRVPTDALQMNDGAVHPDLAPMNDNGWHLSGLAALRMRGRRHRRRRFRGGRRLRRCGLRGCGCHLRLVLGRSGRRGGLRDVCLRLISDDLRGWWHGPGNGLIRIGEVRRSQAAVDVHDAPPLLIEGLVRIRPAPGCDATDVVRRQATARVLPPFVRPFEKKAAGDDAASQRGVRDNAFRQHSHSLCLGFIVLLARQRVPSVGTVLGNIQRPFRDAFPGVEQGPES